MAARLFVLAALIGAVRGGAGLASQPTPAAEGGAAPVATVDRVTIWRQAGVTSLALSNGVDVHLRPMAKSGPGKIVIAAVVPGVELGETAATRGTAMLAVDALAPAPGGVRLRVVQRPEGVLIGVTCGKDEVEGALKQIASTLNAPALDAEGFVKAKERAVAQATAMESRADRAAAEALLRLTMAGDDPRLRWPTAQSLRSVTLEQAAAALVRSFGQGAVDVSIVGDVDVAAVSPIVSSTLGVLPARARDTMSALRSGKRSVQAAGQGDAVVEGGTGRAMLTVSLPAPAISAIGEARLASVAARVLERRVAEGLRESGLKVAQSSGVAMTGRTHADLGSVIESFSLIGDEGRVRGAAKVARERIAQLIDDGPSKSEVQRAVDDAVKEIEPRVESADYWSQSLAMAWFLGVSIDDLGTAPAALREVTAQRLRRHMNEWWKPQGIVTVTLVPKGVGEPGVPAPEPDSPDRPGP